MDVLGPRIIRSINPQGVDSAVSISLQRTSTETIDYGEGVTVDQVCGVAELRADWFERDIKIVAEDEIQLAFRLPWLADTYLLKLARDNGYSLYRIRPGDVIEPFDMFR